MRHASLPILLLTMTTAASPANAQTAAPAPPTPPVAKKVEMTHLLHGDPRPDPYYWLRDKPNPEVAAYLEAENAYTDAILKPTEPLQKGLYDEMVAHIKETDLSVPYRDGEFLYYYRTEKGKQYRIHCRKPFPDGAEQVLVDLNALAAGKKFMSLGAFRRATTGGCWRTRPTTRASASTRCTSRTWRRARCCPSGCASTGDRVGGGREDAVLHGRGRATKRHYRVYRHRLGTPGRRTRSVYEESDEMFSVDVRRSRSRGTSSSTRSEPYDVGGRGPSRRRARRRRGRSSPRASRSHEYTVAHHGDRFYIRTNDGGRNFRIVTAPDRDARAARTGWRSSRTATT